MSLKLTSTVRIFTLEYIDGFTAFLLQDNIWKNSLNDRVNQAAITAFDMAFIIGQKAYEGYEYYDFFEQVFERLKGRPFWSNLTSEREAGIRVFQRNLNEQRTIVIFFFFFCS